MFSGDGVANRNDVLGLDPIRNDDHDRPGCVYRKLKPGRSDGEARRGSSVNE